METANHPDINRFQLIRNWQGRGLMRREWTGSAERQPRCAAYETEQCSDAAQQLGQPNPNPAKAGQRGLVGPEFIKTTQGLEVLRDLAVTDPRGHTNSQNANEYLELVSAALYVISSSPRATSCQ